eukprot:gene17763-biopygen6854
MFPSMYSLAVPRPRGGAIRGRDGAGSGRLCGAADPSLTRRHSDCNWPHSTRHGVDTPLRMVQTPCLCSLLEMQTKCSSPRDTLRCPAQSKGARDAVRCTRLL